MRRLLSRNSIGELSPQAGLCFQLSMFKNVARLIIN